jgi:hypothetical protein
LNVKVTPSKQKTKPGSELDVSVEIEDQSGTRVENVEVCLIVVDERFFLFEFFFI